MTLKGILFDKDGSAGVQIGNLIRVTADGVENMHSSPPDLLRA